GPRPRRRAPAAPRCSAAPFDLYIRSAGTVPHAAARDVAIARLLVRDDAALWRGPREGKVPGRPPAPGRLLARSSRVGPTRPQRRVEFGWPAEEPAALRA